MLSVSFRIDLLNRHFLAQFFTLVGSFGSKSMKNFFLAGSGAVFSIFASLSFLGRVVKDFEMNESRLPKNQVIYSHKNQLYLHDKKKRYFSVFEFVVSFSLSFFLSSNFCMFEANWALDQIGLCLAIYHFSRRRA